MFPTYVITLLGLENRLKEGFSRWGYDAKTCSRSYWSHWYDHIGGSIRITVTISKILPTVCKQNLPRLHFLRLPLLMRNIEKAKVSFGPALPRANHTFIMQFRGLGGVRTELKFTGN